MSEKSANDQTTPLDVGKTCAALYSRVFSRLVTRHYNRALADTGLRVTQFSVLNAIKLAPPNSINELAELLGMERTSLQRTVDKLISKGLLQSQPSGHKRSLGLSLTRQGEEVYGQALIRWEEAHQEFTDLVGEENWSAARSKLQRFSAKLQSTL
ncbi:MAG: MarR family winged helix-turn-helix transcriptional regulator [Pseudomonadales bacterium]|jgi:DNA-binding MarR family transcriptional regulator|nr:MarR family winged helix-turn-helix transcriptional regulator [Pseudomonadales bacterium]